MARVGGLTRLSAMPRANVMAKRGGHLVLSSLVASFPIGGRLVSICVALGIAITASPASATPGVVQTTVISAAPLQNTDQPVETTERPVAPAAAPPESGASPPAGENGEPSGGEPPGGDAPAPAPGDEPAEAPATDPAEAPLGEPLPVAPTPTPTPAPASAPLPAPLPVTSSSPWGSGGDPGGGGASPWGDGGGDSKGPRGGRSRDRGPRDRQRKPGTGFLAGGGAALGVGVIGIGVMGAGLARASRASDDLAGSSPFERSGIFDEGAKANRMAIAGAVVTGLGMAVGIALITVGALKRSRGTKEKASAQSAAAILGGRFRFGGSF